MLKERFERLLAAIGVFRSNWDEVETLYSTGRTYHGLNHIKSLIELNDHLYANTDVFRNMTVSENQAVELAIFYHDVIYDAKRTDNEFQSAEMLKRDVFFCPVRELAVDMILATTHKGGVTERNLQYMCDLDLAGLGGLYDMMAYNTKLIRQEYAHVSDADWVKGRSDFLSALDKRKIFYNPFKLDVFEDLEKNAHENIRKEIVELKSNV
jgi:predicted metal-dependent HD superfamily phosphohydrolase